MKEKGNALIIGILVTVIGGVILFYFYQYANQPKPIYIAQYENKFCPSNLEFYYPNYKSSFKISYKNVGTSGTFSVSLRSDSKDALVKYKGSLEDFKNYTIKDWFVDAGNPVDYDFEIKMNSSSYPNNFTMVAEINCRYDTSISKNLMCRGFYGCCKYSRVADSSQYSLISESC